jgi:hypothetical protein
MEEGGKVFNNFSCERREESRRATCKLLYFGVERNKAKMLLLSTMKGSGVDWLGVTKILLAALLKPRQEGMNHSAGWWLSLCFWWKFPWKSHERRMEKLTHNFDAHKYNAENAGDY